MTGSLQKKLNTHWARSVPDKRLAIQLLRVTPFIFTASRSTMGSLLCCDVEEPFAVLSTSNQYPRIYDGNLWISAKFMSYVRDPLPKCSRRIRVIETCFWLIRILSYSVQYLEEKKEHFAFIESFSIIQEFHTNATVFSQMIGVTEAIGDTNKNLILPRLPLRKKAISKKKRVGVNKKCDFLGPCSNIPPTEDPPQQYSPLKTSSKTSFTVDSLPGVFAVDKPTNYLVTNSSTVIENKENIPITEASIIDSTSPFSKDSSLFKDLFDSNDDYSMELTNLSNNFMTSEILTPSAKLSPNNNTNIITSTVAHSLQASLSESQENKSYSPSTQYFSVQNASDVSNLKTSISSVTEINPDGQITDSLLESSYGLSNKTDLTSHSVVSSTDEQNMNCQSVDVTINATSPTLHKDPSIVNCVRDSVVHFVQGIKRKFSPKGTWVKPLMGRILKPISGNELQPDAKRPRKFASAHSPTALTSAITVSSPNISSISLTDTNSSLGNLGFSSYTLNRSKSYPCNPVNTPSSLPIVRFTERQRNPLHEVVSSSNSSNLKSTYSTESPSCSVTNSISKQKPLSNCEQRILKSYIDSINEIRRIPVNEDNFSELRKCFNL